MGCNYNNRGVHRVRVRVRMLFFLLLTCHNIRRYCPIGSSVKMRHGSLRHQICSYGF